MDRDGHGQEQVDGRGERAGGDEQAQGDEPQHGVVRLVVELELGRGLVRGEHGHGAGGGRMRHPSARRGRGSEDERRGGAAKRVHGEGE